MDNVVLKLLGKSLFSKNMIFDENTDWEVAWNESVVQAVYGVCFAEFETNFSDELQTKITNHMSGLYFNSINNFYNHGIIHKIMISNNIPYVVLKGYVSASYYPEPVYRCMGDVDVLVPEAKIGEVCQIMRYNGFYCENENHPNHFGFRKGKIIVEIHRQIKGIPDGVIGTIIRSYCDDIFENAYCVKTDAGEYMSCSTFHHGLIMLCHVWGHLSTGGIGLRHLCDWAVFANSFSNEEFKKIFEEKLKKVGLWRFAQILTQMSISYLGMPEKEWVMGNFDENVLEALMEDIIQSGNFGRKGNADRKYSSFMMPNVENKNTGSSSKLIRMFKTVKCSINTHWSFTQKYPILFPLGCILYLFRVINLLATGKRHFIRLSKVTKVASERMKAYEYCNIFIPSNT